MDSIEKSKITFFHLPKYFKFSPKSSIKIFDFTLSKIHPTSKKNRWKKKQINELLFTIFVMRWREGGGDFSFSIFCHMSVSICLCVREGRCPKIMIKMKSRKNTKKQSE